MSTHIRKIVSRQKSSKNLDRQLKHYRERHKYDVKITDFPLEIRMKPTNHPQLCFSCRMPMQKGDLQIRLAAGHWMKDSENKFHTQFGSIHIWADKKEKLYQRHIYLHTNCLGCLLKNMYRQVKLNIVPTCDTCLNRFNCYTNNFNLDDINGQPPYVASGKCNTDEEEKGIAGL